MTLGRRRYGGMPARPVPQHSIRSRLEATPKVCGALVIPPGSLVKLTADLPEWCIQAAARAGVAPQHTAVVARALHECGIGWEAGQWRDTPEGAKPSTPSGAMVSS